MCQTENVREIPPIDYAEFEEVGINHNKGLGYVLSYIRTNRGQNKISTDELFEMNKAASIEFINKTYSNFSKSERKMIIAQMEAVDNRFNKPHLKNNKNGRVQDEIQISLNEIAPLMTTTQKLHINHIFQAIGTLEDDIYALQQRFNEIEAEASSIPTDEGAVVFSALSVQEIHPIIGRLM